jgi:hypothetical protein
MSHRCPKELKKLDLIVLKETIGATFI